MPSILEEFAYGNISPEAQFYAKNSEFGKAMALAGKLEEKLLEKLSAEEKEALEELMEAQGEINRLTAVKNLLYGYKLGIVMTAEAFVTSEDLVAGG